MLIARFVELVDQTDQFSKKDPHKARKIAIYGLASEIGSIVSAIKKESLNEGGALSSPLAKSELSEELGDAMWYAFALVRIEGKDQTRDILLSDIENLKQEIGKNDARGTRLRKVLTTEEALAFLDGARDFSANSRATLSDYQRLAFRTARTHGETLLTVCAAVLTQLGAQLMRHELPEIELELNKQLVHRPIDVVLGEIAWHLCAVASLYGLDMNEVAKVNAEKAIARKDDGVFTLLHDRNFPESEQLPRHFDVEFRTMPNGTSQMYWGRTKLGAPLRDQYSEPDGYRFHDVMHLANAACLGWSPVLRDLMGIKRNSCRATKQAEDGGRSAVVEELVVKLIHWEASRRAKEFHPKIPAEDRILFPEGEEIPFSLLKQVRAVTLGHEVYANKYWEWEKSIQEGYRVFQQLRERKGGTVTVNLEERSLAYRPLTKSSDNPMWKRFNPLHYLRRFFRLHPTRVGTTASEAGRRADISV
jgi:NTP pyrophosphatase (non-canonical NTP hydrolase)